jgi:lipopolysaccharide export system protein LptA
MKSSHRICLWALLPVASFLRAAPPTPSDTLIECTGLFETVSTATEITSTFHDNVVVTGNNLRLTCDLLKVVAVQKGAAAPAAIGEYGYFKSLVATGHVQIAQGSRAVVCGRAEILPGEDKIVLTESPELRDGDSLVNGQRITLHRGQQRAEVEGGTHMKLPPLKDLGFDQNPPPPAAPEDVKSPPSK